MSNDKSVAFPQRHISSISLNSASNLSAVALFVFLLRRSMSNEVARVRMEVCEERKALIFWLAKGSN